MLQEKVHEGWSMENFRLWLSMLFQVPCLETDPGEICGGTKGCTQAPAAVLFYKDAVLERADSQPARRWAVSYSESGSP